MDQHRFPNACECNEPGFCPIFMRRMGTNPPDWNWCQRTCYEDRLSYHQLLSKAPKTNNNLLMEFLQDLDDNLDKEFYLTYYLTLSDKYSYCEDGQLFQIKKNESLRKYLHSYKQDNYSFDNVEILVLGHSETQFSTIEDRPYLKKVNLNEIDAGKYSDNKWAEARAFLDPSLFSSNAEWIGFTTASWNLKYEAFSRIDNFHNWNSAKVLINSSPEDNVVLCADIFCPCMWFHKGENVLHVFFGDMAKKIGMKFLDIVGLSFTRHIKSPVSNQMILHKQVYNKYYRYLVDNNIFEKIDDFVNSIAVKHLRKTNQDELTYAHSRLNGYLIEMLTSFWLANQDFLYMPNAARKLEWYNPNKIKHRIKKFV